MHVIIEIFMMIGNLVYFVNADGDGRFTGNEASKFFAMSNVSRQDLKQVLNFVYFSKCMVWHLE